MTNLKERITLVKVIEGLAEKPILDLISLNNVFVNPKTLIQCNELMRVYELGGWRYYGYLPTKFDFWERYKESTLIGTEFNYLFSKNDGFDFRDKNDSCLKEGYKIISLQEFYRIQNISPKTLKKIDKSFKMLKELNKYFGEIK